MHEVIPETVCRFTGVYDKNKNKVWEHDIVKAPFLNSYRQYEDETAVVEWLKGAFCFKHDNEEYGRHFLGYVNDLEVIGNIFDKESEDN